MNVLEIRYKSTWRRRCEGDVIVMFVFFDENAKIMLFVYNEELLCGEVLSLLYSIPPFYFSCECWIT